MNPRRFRQPGQGSTERHDMIDITIHDDARDAIALIQACLDDDVAARKVIHENCDERGVLMIMTGVAAQGLVLIHGEDGAREWLNRMRRQEASEA